MRLLSKAWGTRNRRKEASFAFSLYYSAPSIPRLIDRMRVLFRAEPARWPDLLRSTHQTLMICPCATEGTSSAHIARTLLQGDQRLCDSFSCQLTPPESNWDIRPTSRFHQLGLYTRRSRFG